MKKTISSILSIIMLVGCFSVAAFADAEETVPVYENGKYYAKDYKTNYLLVKTVTKESGGGKITWTYTYDKNYNLVKDKLAYSEGFTSENSFSFDTKNRMTKWVTNDYGDISKQTYSYNSSGLLAKSTSRYGEGDAFKTSYNYDSKGRLIKSVVSNSSDLIKTVTYKYDDHGNITSETNSMPGESKSVTKYVYNKNDYLTKQTSEYGTTTYKYDNNGNLTGISFKGDEWNYTIAYKYNADQKVISATQKDSEGTSTLKLTYDSKGNETKETYKSAYGGSHSKTFSYDKNGLLTKEVLKYSDYSAVTTYQYKKINKPVVKIGYITLSYASTTYNGKAKKPEVRIEGLCNGADYSVSYSNNVKPGKGKVIIKYTDKTYDFVPVVITFDIKPAKPEGLKAADKTKTSVTLAWDKVTGAKKYVVYSYAGGKYTKLTTVATNKAVINNLKAGTAYKFCVKAVASENVSSSYSAKLSVTTS